MSKRKYELIITDVPHPSNHGCEFLHNPHSPKFMNKQREMLFQFMLLTSDLEQQLTPKVIDVKASLDN